LGPDDIAFVKAVVIAVVVAGTSLSAYAIRLRHGARGGARLEQDLQDLLEQEAVRRAALESRLGELEERVDFAERRLVQRRPDLPVTTPV
jgi:hypothetical protein